MNIALTILNKTPCALTIAMLNLAVPAYADVWEFDRAGKMLDSPDVGARSTDNRTYDVEQLPVAVSARDAGGQKPGFAAIYRPMAEGVAALHASDPAVAAAGLGPADFTRLFVALIDQESRFNPNAVSPKGARGLGQLMPATALDLGVGDAFEPLENLRGAARYLVAQLAAFGRADLALAAYNAGPHRVSQYQGLPPFRETRDYVARITRAARLAPAAIPRAPVLQPELISVASSLDSKPRKESVLEWQN